MKKSNCKGLTDKIAKFISDFYSEEYSFRFLLLFCLMAPIVWDFSIIHWIWKIVMIICSLIGMSVLIFLFANLKYRKKRRELYNYIPLSILFILSVFSYYDFEVYGIKTFILGLLIIYLAFVGIYNLLKLFFKKTFLYENFLIILSSFMLVSFWISWVNKNSDNMESSKIFLLIGIILLYLIAIYMIIYRYLYSDKPIELGRKIIGVIFGSGLIIFTFPYFIQWCGITGENFNIFLSIYTAAIGGGLTLIGVAWTIDKNNKDMKREAQLSVKPLIYPIAHDSEYNYREQVDIIFYKDDDVKESNFIGIIKNTDNGVLIIKEAIVNNAKCEMKYPVVLDKNVPAQILIYSSNKIEIESMYILGNDILGNNLKYRLIVDNNRKDIDSVKEEL